jgi:hypothetical protein
LPGSGYADERVGHPAFELQPAVEDDVGLFEAADVAGAGAVEVGVDAGAHQGDDLDPIAADVPGEVADHADRRRDPDRLGVLPGASPCWGRDQRREQQNQRHRHDREPARDHCSSAASMDHPLHGVLPPGDDRGDDRRKMA